jgi:hypothetical protein
MYESRERTYDGKKRAARKRAEADTKSSEWFCNIVTHPITGDLAVCEPGAVAKRSGAS